MHNLLFVLLFDDPLLEIILLLKTLCTPILSILQTKTATAKQKHTSTPIHNGSTSPTGLPKTMQSASSRITKKITKTTYYRRSHLHISLTTTYINDYFYFKFQQQRYHLSISIAHFVCPNLPSLIFYVPPNCHLSSTLRRPMIILLLFY